MKITKVVFGKILQVSLLFLVSCLEERQRESQSNQDQAHS